MPIILPLPIIEFDSFMASPPVLPKFYWDAESQEQRIKRICEQLKKLAEYLNKITTTLNQLADAVEQLGSEYDQMEAEIRELQSRLSRIEIWINYINDYVDLLQRICDTISRTLYTSMSVVLPDEPGPWHTAEDRNTDPNYPHARRTNEPDSVA